MPLKSGKSQKVVSSNIRELHHGPKFQKTKKEHGEEAAHKQAIAIAMSKAGLSKKKRKKSAVTESISMLEAMNPMLGSYLWEAYDTIFEQDASIINAIPGSMTTGMNDYQKAVQAKQRAEMAATKAETDATSALNKYLTDMQTNMQVGKLNQIDNQTQQGQQQSPTIPANFASNTTQSTATGGVTPK